MWFDDEDDRPRGLFAILDRREMEEEDPDTMILAELRKLNKTMDEVLKYLKKIERR